MYKCNPLHVNYIGINYKIIAKGVYLFCFFSFPPIIYVTPW